RWAARALPGRGPPARDRLFADPDRQAATLPQGSIIFTPVGYPILLLGDVMTAIGIGLEWHSGHPKGLWIGVAPPIWDCSGAVQPSPASAKARARKGGPSSTLPGPSPQPS